MRKHIAVLGLLLTAIFGMSVHTTAAAGNGVDPDTNHVEYWCSYAGFKWDWDAGQLGSKEHYTVPPAHVGHVWTLLVIKAGTENTVFQYPIPGNVYVPANGKDISHVILCKEPIPEETTTSTEETTTTSSTTSTTIADTTTTVGDTTTTDVNQIVTTVPTTTIDQVVDTVVTETGQPPVPALPRTGFPIWEAMGIGILIVALGWSLVLIHRNRPV